MNIIGTGLSGLVGSRVVELLSPKYSFTNYSLENGVDITDAADIRRRILASDASWMFHFAAYTNVQGAEKERQLGEQSAAWKVNVLATETIVEACRESRKHLLYIDTDYAFDGTRKTPYAEEDTPNPQGWYAKTKYEGALRVAALGTLGVIARISNPYRAHPVGKTDFVHKILARLEKGEQVTAPHDQLFVPTFIDDIAAAADALVTTDSSGVYHVVGSTAVSPYEAAERIAEVYAADRLLVHKTTFAEYFADRAPVPQYAVLSNRKIASLGVSMRGFADGISEVFRQEQQQ